MGVRINRLRVPAVDDDHGLSSIQRSLILKLRLTFPGSEERFVRRPRTRYEMSDETYYERDMRDGTVVSV